MATFVLDKIVNFSTITGLTSIDWELSTDNLFNNIIAFSYKDTINLKTWHVAVTDNSGSVVVGDNQCSIADGYLVYHDVLRYEESVSCDSKLYSELPDCEAIIDCDTILDCSANIDCGISNSVVYSDLYLYARVRLHYEEPASKLSDLSSGSDYNVDRHHVVSDWFYSEGDQSQQNVTITYPDGSVESTTSQNIGWS